VGRATKGLRISKDVASKDSTSPPLDPIKSDDLGHLASGENRLMLAMAMQAGRMGVWERDIATGTVTWSEELENIFGLEKGAFTGDESHFYELIHEDDRERVWSEVERSIIEKRPYTVEFRLHHADGSVRWMEGRGEAVYSETGKPVRLYGIAIDITERKHTEEALRESEERFSRFMEQLPGLAWIKDINGRYVYANETALRSFGVTDRNLYGKNDNEVFPPEIAHQFIDHDRQAVESGKGTQIVESMVEEDGVLHHSIVSKFPIADASGRTALIGGMAIDITSQKQAEDELRRRMEFDEAVMSNMGEGLYTVDAHGLVTSMNPAAEKLFGWTFEELHGRKIHEAVHYKHRDGSTFPADQCAGLQVLQQGKLLVNHEDVFIKKDGTFFDVLYSSAPIVTGEKVTGLVVVFQDITERKRADEALERYRLLSEFASDIIWLLREDGSIVEVNRSAIETYGYSTEELLRMNVRDLRHPSRATELEGQLRAARDARVHFETIHVRKDGTSLDVEVRASSAEFGGERLIMGIIRDVTERKRREVNDKYLLRLGDLIRMETDPDRLLSRVTESMAEHLGAQRCFVSSVDLDQHTSTILSSYQAGSLGPLVETVRFADYAPANLEAAIAGKTIVVSDSKLDPRTSGKYGVSYGPESLRSYVAVPLMRDRRWTGVLFVSRNKPHEWSEIEISLAQSVAERVWLAYEKLRSDIALRKSEKRATEEYQSLLERIVPLAETLGGARDLISVYRSLQEFICASMNCSGFFVSFYDAVNHLRLPAYIWGEGKELDVATLPPMPITAEGGPNSRAILGKQTVITSNYWNEQQVRPHVVLLKGGDDPMSSLVVPMVIQERVIGTLEVQAHQDGVFHREHAIALEMAANLTAVAIENVRLIETEAKARTEAETANRMKDEFLSVLSHELRTPLNAMLGWVRILRTGNVDEERMSKALEIIERNTRQQSSLIEDLLDVSRIISGKMRLELELVDLVPAIQQAAESVRLLASAKAIDLSIAVADEPLYLDGDAVRLQQVFTNLLQNAIKFTAPGGSVSLDWRREDSEVVIDVVDTGIGIEEKFIPFIFDRFSQADASTKRHNTGLGLGLTIVRTIAELHGGSTSVHSDGPGKGSAFTVRLPLSEEYYQLQVLPKIERQNGSGASLAGVNILLVDDDEDGLVPLRMFLEKEKARVTCTLSAGEALSEMNKQDFDILISDIGMPSMDGLELISAVRRETSKPNHTIKAIAYTAYASEDDKAKILSAGYQVHLVKPLDLNELLVIVQELRVRPN